MIRNVLFVVVAALTGCGMLPVPAQCTPRHEGGAFCVPDGGGVGTNLKLQLRDPCGSVCDKGVVGCFVTVDGGTLVLELVGERCFVPGEACPAVCAVRDYGCGPPPLADGTYTVVSPGQPAQQLIIRADGAGRCAL